MKTMSRFIIILLVCFTSVLNFSGCTLCGFGIGAIVDSCTPSNEEILSPSAIIAANKGDNISLLTNDDRHWMGTFIKIDTNWSNDYIEKYEAARTNLLVQNILLPEIGETIEIQNDQNEQLTSGTFLGFEWGETIWLLPHDNNMPSKWFLSSSRHICKENGEIYDTEKLKTVLIQHEIPTPLSFSIKTTIDTVTIPMSEVKYLEQNNYKYGPIIGMGVGLAIDVAIIVAISASGGLFGGAQ